MRLKYEPASEPGNGGVTDFEKFGRPELIHLAFLALDDYRKVLSASLYSISASLYYRMCPFIIVCVPLLSYASLYYFDKFGRPELLHLAFLALDDYRKVSALTLR